MAAVSSDTEPTELPVMSHKTRIMYIEYKGDGLVGPARIGRVTYSKTGKSLTYRGKEFGSLNGTGFKANFVEVESGDQYWISGCKRTDLIRYIRTWLKSMTMYEKNIG